MTSKSILIFVALFLLIARMGSSDELVHDVQSRENHHHHHHDAKAPLLAPAANPPTHAPKNILHAPAKAPAVHAPKTSPLFSAPIKSPAPAPVSPPSAGCVTMCASHCRPVSPKRACMRSCTMCCAKFKCVPKFSKCSNWGKVAIHGYLVNCP